MALTTSGLRARQPPSNQVLCLLNDKGDEGLLLEDPDRPIHRCGIRSGSTLFLSFLTAPAPADSPAPRAHAAKAAAAAATPPDAEEDGHGAAEEEEVDLAAREERAEARARAECRAWCGQEAAARAAARAEAERVAGAERMGALPSRLAPAPVTAALPGTAGLLTTSKPPQRAELAIDESVILLTLSLHHY